MTHRVIPSAVEGSQMKKINKKLLKKRKISARDTYLTTVLRIKPACGTALIP